MVTISKVELTERLATLGQDVWDMKITIAHAIPGGALGIANAFIYIYYITTRTSRKRVIYLQSIHLEHYLLKRGEQHASQKPCRLVIKLDAVRLHGDFTSSVALRMSQLAACSTSPCTIGAYPARPVLPTYTPSCAPLNTFGSPSYQLAGIPNASKKVFR
jgi:hypothetical protein